MYNDRRYSLARYSVNRETKTVEIAESFYGVMGAVAGAAVHVETRTCYAGTVRGSARGTVSVISAFPAASGLFAAVRISANVITQAALSGALHGSVCARKDTPAALSALDSLDARVLASKDLPAFLALASRLRSRTVGAKNVPAPLAVSGVLTSMLEATSQTTQRATFQLTIPPGGELRIDSELFTVLLDGENALHTQSGDWINVSRELLRLTVESASGGGLQGQLIYTERYL